MLCLLTLLFSCARTPNYELYSSFDELAYPQSVDFYQSQADLVDDESQKNTFLLKVAGRLIYEGRMRRASQLLNDLPSLSLTLQNEKKLLLARLALFKRNLPLTSRLLTGISMPGELPIHLQKVYYQLLADFYHARNKTLEEVRALIVLDQLQQSSLAKLETRRAIWQSLSNLSLSTEKAFEIESTEALEGWLSLNLLSRTFQSKELIDAIAAWKKAHPTHPANDIIKTNHRDFIALPKKIAVLLPLSGGLSGPGKAIREGFMAAYFKSKQKGALIRFYDTHENNATTLYRKAIDEGADFVVGPLAKKDVDSVAKSHLSVPTLSLNDSDVTGSDNFYRFSIDPQNEARQLAYKVHQDGFRRALVIAPQGDWGGSLSSAFTRQWESMGGAIAEHFYFDNKTEVNASIRQLLHVSDSQDRYNALVQTLWKRPKFYARRRQDFDVIILLSYASMARQLKPMLNYYYAGNVPMYATSLVYSGSKNKQQDMDLNGIIFGEMPYLLSAKPPLVSQSWPEQFNSYNRLYAMGSDAYLLTQQLNQLMLFPMMGVRNNTGTLFIDEHRQIIRQLEWAQFKKGIVQPLVPNT